MALGSRALKPRLEEFEFRVPNGAHWISIDELGTLRAPRRWGLMVIMVLSATLMEP
jgi:hypothetical protein